MAHGLVKKFKDRRTERRHDRREKRRAEGRMRNQARDWNQQAVNEAQAVQGSAPNLDAQVAANRQLWNQGSQQANQSTAGLQAIANQGFTQQDNETIQAGMNQANQAAGAQRAATMQQAASRGQAGGGLAMMSALQANQGAANANQATAAQVGMQRAQNRQQGERDLFSANMQRGAAADQFNQNMLQNQQGLQQQNFGNQMAATGLATGQLNQSAGFNQGAAQQLFDNRQKKFGNILNFANSISGMAAAGG